MRLSTNLRTGLAAVIGLGLGIGALPAAAQHHRGKDRRENAIEAHKDRRNIRDDKRDLAVIRDIEQSWSLAVKRRDKVAERVADQRLHDWLASEMRENDRELADARKEAAHSDSRRDRRDDQRDAAKAWRDNSETRKVARDLRQLQRVFNSNRATPDDYRRKARLLKKLVKMAKQEIREDKKEIKEDRRERREDRRDRRR